MIYKQKTYLKSIRTIDVIRCFHKYKFVEFLTSGQPVKIKSWIGIDDGKEASFCFWFFGWKKITVLHENYTVSRNSLYFVDKGLELPFGLKKWEHHHIIKRTKKGSLIIDKIYLDDSIGLKKYFIYPIMLFPVVIRKITYKIWFYMLEGKSWSSLKAQTT